MKVNGLFVFGIMLGILKVYGERELEECSFEKLLANQGKLLKSH